MKGNFRETLNSIFKANFMVLVPYIGSSLNKFNNSI
jgi:hypothetical protein